MTHPAQQRHHKTNTPHPSQLCAPGRLLAAPLLTLVVVTLLVVPGSAPQADAAEVDRLYLPLLLHGAAGVPVARIVDGDTIKVQIDGQLYPLRYIGIDTPETYEPYFSPSSAANCRLVQGQSVTLERDVSEVDPYNRLLRYVYRADGTFVNAELVRLGWARVANYRPDERYQDLFAELERDARASGLGMWADPPSTPPTPAGDIVIRAIFPAGSPPGQSDEFVEIANQGTTPVDLFCWRLNAGDRYQDFYFPGHTLQPGQVCRVYTSEVHPESCGFSFENSSPIWNNRGDCGYLYDASGTEVSQVCYP